MFHALTLRKSNGSSAYPWGKARQELPPNSSLARRENEFLRVRLNVVPTIRPGASEAHGDPAFLPTAGSHLSGCTLFRVNHRC